MWKIFLKEAVRDPAELCRILGISTETVDLDPDFPMIVHGPFWQRIKKGDPNRHLPRAGLNGSSGGFTVHPEVVYSTTNVVK